MSTRRRLSTSSIASERSVISPSSDASSVRVVCRVRPLNGKEKRLGSTPVCAHVLAPEDDVVIDEEQEEEDEKEGKSTTLTIKMEEGARHTFTFDQVFDVESTQREVYAGSARPIIEDVFKGYNGTVFAYGQTGAGKTFTMEGNSIRKRWPRGRVRRFEQKSAHVGNYSTSCCGYF